MEPEMARKIKRTVHGLEAGGAFPASEKAGPPGKIPGKTEENGDFPIPVQGAVQKGAEARFPASQPGQVTVQGIA
jgi:hypothetical protein